MPRWLVETSKITQGDDGAAVRLSASLLERAGLHHDEPVDIIAHDDEIIIRRQVVRRALDELLARFDPEKHRHDLMLDDAPVGGETI